MIIFENLPNCKTEIIRSCTLGGSVKNYNANVDLI